MRFGNRRESSNIENRRGEGGLGPGGGLPLGGGLGGGGFGGGGLLNLLLSLIGNRFGLFGVAAVLGIAWFLNSQGAPDGGALLAPAAQAPASGGADGATLENATDHFVAQVLGSTEDTWGRIFAERGGRYQPPTLVFFANGIETACGGATSAVGPFYCPADRKVYLDTSFFDELKNRFKAPGDFAEAYVVAHEVGHHVQNLLGTSAEVQQQERRLGAAARNRLSVRLELQADCYAGVWAGQNRDILDSGDFAEGVTAAQAIGDDTLQRAAQGRVVPDSFTHGTSAQRIRWLERGFNSGDPAQCNTFDVADGAL